MTGLHLGQALEVAVPVEMDGNERLLKMYSPFEGVQNVSPLSVFFCMITLFYFFFILRRSEYRKTDLERTVI
jgi:hypothetical protein